MTIYAVVPVRNIQTEIKNEVSTSTPCGWKWMSRSLWYQSDQQSGKEGEQMYWKWSQSVSLELTCISLTNNFGFPSFVPEKKGKKKNRWTKFGVWGFKENFTRIRRRSDTRLNLEWNLQFCYSFWVMHLHTKIDVEPRYLFLETKTPDRVLQRLKFWLYLFVNVILIVPVCKWSQVNSVKNTGIMIQYLLSKTTLRI